MCPVIPPLSPLESSGKFHASQYAWFTGGFGGWEEAGEGLGFKL